MNVILSLPDVIYTTPLSSLDEQKETKKINWYTFSNGLHDGVIVVLVDIVVLSLLPHFLLLLQLLVGSRELENQWCRKITHIWCQKTTNKTIKVTYNLSCNKNKFQDLANYAWNIFTLHYLLSIPNFSINESDNTKFYLTTLNKKHMPNCHKPHI